MGQEIRDAESLNILKEDLKRVAFSLRFKREWIKKRMKAKSRALKTSCREHLFL